MTKLTGAFCDQVNVPKDRTKENCKHFLRPFVPSLTMHEIHLHLLKVPLVLTAVNLTGTHPTS
jgi:hypothetical protein